MFCIKCGEKLQEMQAVLSDNNSLDEYIIEEVDRTSYSGLLKELELAIGNKDTDKGKILVDEITKMKGIFIEQSKNFISNKVSELESADTSLAYDFERLMI